MEKKRLLEWGVFRTNLYRRIARRYSGVGIVCMFHTISDNGEFCPGGQMRCGVKVLDILLRYVCRRGIDVVTMDEALNQLDNRSGGRFAVVTFDDGYKDNLTLALPILERYGAPATIYVTTCMIERTEGAWWVGLAEWLKRREHIAVEGFGGRETRTLAEKSVARSELKAWLTADIARLDPLRRAMRADGIDEPSILNREALTRNELRSLATHPLITIGGHTTSHPWLARLSEDQARREIAENRNYLQDLTQGEVAHFAYPYGGPVACNEREARLVAEAGFRSAVTTRRGCIFPAHSEYRYALPREPIDWDDTEARIICKDAGFHPWARNLKLKRPWGSPVVTMETA
jgi:peptidoglycan/xylan/chitin deacetylase (PgdA/CDA1 family)